jgi:tRNA1Val (adenine37-N6)-methyltransferase
MSLTPLDRYDRNTVTPNKHRTAMDYGPSTMDFSNSMRRKGLFQFKQFSVAHDRSTHKIGTDGVLLGAWADVSNVQYILDVGTGTGVIALMMAQRTAGSVLIDAVEIEKEDSEQALQNVLQSPWASRIGVHHTAIQNFSPSRQYDLVISNPPYFVNSWKPPEKKRSQARHTHELSFDELLTAALSRSHYY